MKRYQSWISSFLLGSIALCGFSFFQKLMAGYLITPLGFLVPFFAGGTFGLLIGMRHDSLAQAKNELQKAYNAIEHQVKKRTAELTKTNGQFTENIDRYKQIEKELLESEQKYRLLVRF